MRNRVVADGIRMDGRGPKDLRPLSAEVGILPTAHGSALFQRGETQVLNVMTLGMPRMAQSIGIDDTIAEDTKKRFLHHYNMPPYANGETGRLGTNRRSTGHGLLGERAMLPLVPSEEDFAYTLRLVSEVLSSNGSTSMASVCAGSMAMMDGGVPLHAAVAGIAMGLIYEDGKYITLTDILGSEDTFGDMDFKVAGTSEFVTALQLDTKIDGLPADVLAQALQQAREARLQILEVMNKAISEPRPEVRDTAPKIVSFEIPIDKIGEVIGPKGKVINLIQQETGADVNVDDDGQVGTVTIGSKDGVAVAEARRRIEMILDPPGRDGRHLQGQGRQHQILRRDWTLIHVSLHPGAEDANLKEQAVGVHLFLQIIEPSPGEAARLVGNFRQHAPKMIERIGHYWILRRLHTLAIKPVGREQVTRLSLQRSLDRGIGVLQFHQKTLGAIQMIAKHHQHHTLPALLAVRSSLRLVRCDVPTVGLRKMPPRQGDRQSQRLQNPREAERASPSAISSALDRRVMIRESTATPVRRKQHREQERSTA